MGEDKTGTSLRTAGLIIAAVFIAYFNAFWGVFQFDDYNVIVNYSPVHTLGGCLSDMRHGIRPLLKLSYALNWVSPFGIFGFHFFNIAIHAGNSLLVYCLAETYSERHNVSEIPRRRMAALATALIFALHPVQTEAVTYVSGRSMSLMAFFYLASLWVYIRGGKFHWYVLSALLFMAAVAVKEVAVTLPFALLLWEAGELKCNWKKVFHRQMAHWCLLIAIALGFLADANYHKLLTYGFTERSLFENILTQINAVAYLISHLFWMGRLNIDPDLPSVHELNWMTIIQAMLLVGTFSLAVFSRERIWWRFGALWFVLQILPTNSAIPRLDVANERHLYLAMVGIALPLGIEISRLSKPAGRGSMALGILVMAAFTIGRNQDYHSEAALWEDTARKSPYKARVFNNLGVAYELSGQADKAKAAYSRALRLDPDYGVASANLERLQTGNNLNLQQ